MAKTDYGYAPPRALAENIWEVRGEWANKMGRRMTVVRLSDGRLFVHNAIRLREPELAWLQGLGPLAYIAAPNKFHCSDAPWLAGLFPRAELFAPASKLEEFRALGLNPRDVNRDFPGSPELSCIPMNGTRIEEAAFYHAPSRTLILCDLAFHMEDVFTGLEKVFMSWNKVGGQFGPRRLTKLVFASDRAALLDSYRALLELDFDRVVVNHGAVLESGGKQKLKEGIERVFG